MIRLEMLEQKLNEVIDYKSKESHEVYKENFFHRLLNLIFINS